MVNIDMLQKAIAAHASWKSRLRAAVSSGQSEVSVAAAKVDNQCEFGKWLYGSELSPSEKQTDHYRTVRELHAQFHLQAAQVLQWAQSGEKQLAEQAIGLGGDYAKISTALTEAMIRWRTSVH